MPKAERFLGSPIEWEDFGFPVSRLRSTDDRLGQLLQKLDKLHGILARIERNTAKVNPTPEERAAAEACMPDALPAVEFEQYGRIVGVRRL